MVGGLLGRVIGWEGVFFCHRHRLNSKCRPGYSCRAQPRAGGLRRSSYHFPCCCFSRSVYSPRWCGGARETFRCRRRRPKQTNGPPPEPPPRQNRSSFSPSLQICSLFRYLFFLSRALYHCYQLLNEPQSRTMFVFDFEWQYAVCNNNNKNIYYKIFFSDS